MDINYILPKLSPICQGFPNINIYEIEVNLSSNGEESKYIIVPADCQEVIVTINPKNNAKGTIYTTTDLLSNVQDDNEDIDWVEWDQGEVSEAYQDSCSVVTALKVEQTAEGDPGTVKTTMRFQ